MPEGESRVLKCGGCGALYPAMATNEGELIPVGSAGGGSCHHCGSNEFEQVTLTRSE